MTSHTRVFDRIHREFDDIPQLLHQYDILVKLLRQTFQDLGGRGARYVTTRYSVLVADDSDRLRTRQRVVDIGIICQALGKAIEDEDRREHSAGGSGRPAASVGGKFRTGGGAGPKVAKGKDGGVPSEELYDTVKELGGKFRTGGGAGPKVAKGKDGG